MTPAGLLSLVETIRRHGLAADKRLGQHFLVDPAILRRIADAAAPLDQRVVLEIGPGPGGLTRALLETGAAKVVAIEADHRCLAPLAELRASAAGRLELVHADALRIEHTDLAPPPSVVVANLPYNVGTELLVRWLRRPAALTHLVLLLQREVAQRLGAASHTAAYGRLSVLAQTCARVSVQFDLPPGAFRPPPKVHSRLIRLDLATERPAEPHLAALERVTAAAFGQRRKMLKTSLKPLDRDPLALCDAVGIDPTQRAETVSVAGFNALAARLAAEHSGPEALGELE